jgi:hypothetical protein
MKKDRILRLTGCQPLRSFHGRVYQLTPGTDEGHDYRVCAGGVLPLRDDRTKAMLAEVSNTGAGDCAIFRLGDDIEPRVQPVIGEVPRQAYAGWFHDGPTYLDRLTAR